MSVDNLIQKKDYEKVLYVLRRHPLTFVPTLILTVVLAAMPPIVYWMISTLFPLLFQKEALYALTILGGSIYYVSLLLFFYTQFVVFYLDIWIVTNDRIIDIEQIGLFSRTVSELELFRIQDITTDINGMIPTFFRYGNVMIKTASDNINIVFYDVPHANRIREELITLSHEDRKYHYGITMNEDS
ncbi:PH domain-containing protein [Patescibacteria group bacterium]|nr:PH domain-containing protein [Patescibacteria group bacterium]MBU1721240.1 PH domain-containing protein [Patescibacteria group bacterium]MBU1901052.1 PH domain-containing protein [Patescibacteria group bacterium]